MKVPRTVRAAANKLAQQIYPGKHRMTRHVPENILRADIRDAYINGWLDAQPQDSNVCDECDGSGTYYIDGKPQACICSGSET